MNRSLAVCSLILVAGCSSSSSNGGGGDDAATDTALGQDSPGTDSTTPVEASPGDAPADTAPGSDAADGGSDAHDGSPGDGGPDAPDGGSDGGDAEAGPPQCTGSWLVAPTVPALALPDGGTVILHAAGSGTQDYACVGTFVDAGADSSVTFKWTLTGPEAELDDCNGTLIGHHFASEAGAAAPEWQQLDGTYVIGHKIAPVTGYTPDGGSGSVPWLLLQTTTTGGGSGTLASTLYIQRLNTDGGNAPATGCADDAGGATTKVPYTADYYFFGP